MDDVDWIGGEHSQVERPLHVLGSLSDVSVRNDHVVDVFLLVSRIQSASLGDLALPEPLAVLGSLHDNVFGVYFPEPVSLGLDSND